MSPHTGSMSPHTGSMSHPTGSMSRTFSEEKMSFSPAQSPLSNLKVGKNQTVDLVMMIISTIFFMLSDLHFFIKKDGMPCLTLLDYSSLILLVSLQ